MKRRHILSRMGVYTKHRAMSEARRNRPDEIAYKSSPALQGRLFKTLRCIANATYPNQIKKFSVRLRLRESKSFHGLYDLDHSEIRLYNFYRPFGCLVATGIHELAHHCEFVLCGKTGHTPRFYQTMFDLMRVALERGWLLYNDIEKIGEDSPSARKFLAHYGAILASVPTPDPLPPALIVKVFNVYNIKEELKSAGYMWSALEAAYTKEIPASLIDDERSFLDSLNAEQYTIGDIRRTGIDLYYSVLVYDYAAYRPSLIEAGYILNGYGYSYLWVKRIPATSKQSEIAFLRELGCTEYEIVARE